MATAEAAVAVAGGAVLLYLALLCRLSLVACRLSHQDVSEREEGDEEEKSSWPEIPPSTWLEGATVATKAVLFACGETIGKWPIGDIAFGIKRQMKRLVLYNVEDFRDIIFVHSILTQTVVLFFMSILQGNLQHEYTGSNCVQLSGCETLSELTELLRYLNLCFYFSKKPFPAFLEFGFQIQVFSPYNTWCQHHH